MGQLNAIYVHQEEKCDLLDKVEDADKNTQKFRAVYVKMSLGIATSACESGIAQTMCVHIGSTCFDRKRVVVI